MKTGNPISRATRRPGIPNPFYYIIFKFKKVKGKIDMKRLSKILDKNSIKKTADLLRWFSRPKPRLVQSRLAVNSYSYITPPFIDVKREGLLERQTHLLRLLHPLGLADEYLFIITMKHFCQALRRIFLCISCISWWKMGYKNSYCDLNRENTIKGFVFFLPQKANQDFRQINFKHIFVDKKSNTTGLQLADLVARPLALHYLRPGQENRAFSSLKEKLFFRVFRVVRGGKGFLSIKSLPLWRICPFQPHIMSLRKG